MDSPFFIELAPISKAQTIQVYCWIGQFTQVLQTEVAVIRNQPLVIDLDQDQACQAQDSRLIRKHVDYARATLDLLVEAFQRMGRIEARLCCFTFLLVIQIYFVLIGLSISLLL